MSGFKKTLLEDFGEVGYCRKEKTDRKKAWKRGQMLASFTNVSFWAQLFKGKILNAKQHYSFGRPFFVKIVSSSLQFNMDNYRQNLLFT